MPESAYSFLGHEFEEKMKVFTLSETPHFFYGRNLRLNLILSEKFINASMPKHESV